jgi:hypothetical protein
MLHAGREASSLGTVAVRPRGALPGARLVAIVPSLPPPSLSLRWSTRQDAMRMLCFLLLERKGTRLDPSEAEATCTRAFVKGLIVATRRATIL